MNFELNEEQRAIREAIREVAEKEIAPRAAYYDQTGEFPWENVRTLARYGYLGVTVPVEYGGAGADMVSSTIIIEEVSRACAATGTVVDVHSSLFTEPVIRFGNEEQKRRYLPDLAGGRKLGAFCLTEPQAGSDAANQKTTAVLDGDHYVLNGTKCLISNGGAADLYLVMAVTDKGKGSKGISAFIVEKGMEGLSFGQPEDKLGIRASWTSDVILEGVRVPRENLLGREGEGYKIALATLDGGRVGIAAQAVGITQAALDRCVRYAKERHQFGQAIASFQAIQWMLAEMATDLEAARLLTYRAAFLHDRGVRYSKEAAMAKLFASTMAMKHTVKAVQIHGGYGYTREYVVERLMRDAKITEIYEGTSEVMKLVIAANLLGLK